MTRGMRRLAVLVILALVATGIAGRAHGFFPMGGFNMNQQLRYATWPFREFDTNENGVIEQGEGLEFRIEGGPRGFTPDEIEQVKAGFRTWQDVPTSYAAFRFVGVIEDPIVPGLGQPDFLPTVFMQVTDVAEGDGYSQPDAPDVLVPGLGGPLVGITFILYTIDITAIPVGGNVVIVPAGTILDCDIVINASWHRAGLIEDTTFGVVDLQATVTHAVGTMLGLAWTPLNNLDPINSALGLSVEPAVLQMTGTDGIARMAGATPTMFPEYFLTQMPNGDHIAGWRDLAPDDISGVSWLYPREDGLENFFSIQHEARTQVRRATGIPSAPISGAHIVAWADVTESATGRRVPLFSTMSGLYELYSNIQLSGRFNLMGLWKQMEVPGRDGVLFEPSYVITMNPLNGLGYDRQAPPGMTSATVDSVQGQFPISFSTIVRPPADFSTNYPSEVFHEDGNIYGIDNNPAGTPLVWSFQKNAVVSATTNKTLPRMLPRNKPMFGDPDTVCPMNIIENIGGGTLPTAAGLNNSLRSFRDNTLLQSAVGTAFVDLYYRAAPFVSYQLLRHDIALNLARGGIIAMLWIWERMMTILVILMVLASLAVVLVGRGHARSARAAAAVVVLLALILAATANAAQLPISLESLVAESMYIVSGKVVSAEGFQAQDTRIYTEVVFEITDVAKGDLNRGSLIGLTVIGGHYGTLALAALGLPNFVEGEHAVLHLVDVPGYGLTPYGGMRSKTPIFVNPETGEEEVVVGEEEVDERNDNDDDAEEEAPEEDAAEENDATADEDEGQEKSVRRPLSADREALAGRVPVRAYMRQLRAIANSQR